MLEQKRAAKATREALKCVPQSSLLMDQARLGARLRLKTFASRIVADAAKAKRSADADKELGDGEDTEESTKREEKTAKEESAGGLAGMLGSWLGGKGE